MGREEMRAADADREMVAERLRTALNEGRIDLAEFDERLQRAYGAKTYGELDGLLTDLPGVTPPSAQQLAVPADSAVEWAPRPDGRYPTATRRWLAENWTPWAATFGITSTVWAVSAVAQADLTYFWPAWVGGPWGAVLVVGTIAGLVNGEPQRWAAKQARKEARRREKAREIRDDDE
ncbi:DUF1707 SHOCT-like domain-containing protein [Catenuloplanes japonicus]|uniref:DUF1707 SHOCT-like domain-containing protein n=1 Tax=Catenuloplanes japonicus TaxID=33876 RepID=UPI001E384A90|nr:DUF1707 domain-containing protein [Catenuloplanes japonicus]